MLSLNPPEPAKFYRARLEQSEAQVIAELDEPLHPSRLNAGNLDPLWTKASHGGVTSYQDIELTNYARARRAVRRHRGRAPDPGEAHGQQGDRRSGGNAAPGDERRRPELRDGRQHPDDRPGLPHPEVRRLRPVGHQQLPPVGSSPSHGREEERDGQDRGDGRRSRRSSSLPPGSGDNNPTAIDSDFNKMVQLKDESETFGSEVRPSLPITITASFSGMLTLTVIYEAIRTDEALERWKATTYAAIIKGYNAKKQAYDQALAVAEAQVANRNRRADLPAARRPVPRDRAHRAEAGVHRPDDRRDRARAHVDQRRGGRDADDHLRRGRRRRSRQLALAAGQRHGGRLLRARSGLEADDVHVSTRTTGRPPNAGPRPPAPPAPTLSSRASCKPAARTWSCPCTRGSSAP